MQTQKQRPRVPIVIKVPHPLHWVSGLLLLTMSQSCSTPPDLNLEAALGLVPSTSIGAGLINWSSVRANPLLMSFFRGEEGERVFKEFGLDTVQVRQIVVFDDGAGGQGSSGMILVGDLNSRAIVSQLIDQGYSSRTHGQQEIYCDSRQVPNCVVTVSTRILAIGTSSAVASVLEIMTSGAGSFAARSGVQSLISSDDDTRAAPVRLLVVPSQGATDAARVAVHFTALALDLLGAGPIASILQTLGVVEGAELAFSAKETRVQCDLWALMRDESAAVLVSGSLNLLHGIAQAFPGAPTPPAGPLDFNTLAVSHNGRMLRIGVQLQNQKP